MTIFGEVPESLKALTEDFVTILIVLGLTNSFHGKEFDFLKPTNLEQKFAVANIDRRQMELRESWDQTFGIDRHTHGA